MRNLSKVARVGGAVTVAGVAATTALVMTPGTFGSFSAATSNPGNNVQAGTVHMTNSVVDSQGNPAALSLIGLSAPFSATNMKPGQSVSGQVTITNSGTLPVTASLALSNVTGNVTDVHNGTSDSASDWTITVADDATPTAHKIFNNVDLANASAQPLPASGTATSWAAGESHTYTVTVTLNSYASNDEQGANPSFELDWASSQA